MIGKIVHPSIQITFYQTSKVSTDLFGVWSYLVEGLGVTLLTFLFKELF